MEVQPQIQSTDIAKPEKWDQLVHPSQKAVRSINLM